MASFHPAVARLLASPGGQEAFDALIGASGADLTSLLLAVFDERSGRLRAPDVLRRYRSDRFVRPAHVDPLVIGRIELDALALAAESYEPIVLAPMAPLGAHAGLGATPQNNVVTTVRGAEVTADPTNSLALVAADRRSEILQASSRSAQPVLLAAHHRVVRAQNFSGPRSFAHFSLLGLVAAGRDTGRFGFEVEMVATHVRTLIGVVRSVTDAKLHVRLSAFHDDLASQCQGLGAALTAPDVEVTMWPERDHGRGYYQSLAFNLSVDVGGESWDIGDGGDVDWTQNLLQNRKERLVIGGLGLERLAQLKHELAIGAR